MMVTELLELSEVQGT